MKTAPPNDVGLTGLANYDDLTHRTTLRQQLAAQGVDLVEFGLPTIVGMGGAAQVICYTSPKTGGPVTILLVPRLLGDQYAEDYYYFAGMTAGEARTVDWVGVYDAVTQLAGQP